MHTNQQKALRGLIQGEENIPLTALGFAASKAVCGSGLKWPITHIYKSLITTLLYWPLVWILVACLMWKFSFSTSTSVSLKTATGYTCVLFTAPILQICWHSSSNPKKQQEVHLAPVVGYMVNIYLFPFDWNYSDLNPSSLFTLMLNEVIHRHVHARKHLIWIQKIWRLKYMKRLICLKYNRCGKRRTLVRIFNPFIHGFATRASRCPAFHSLSPVPHMSQCPTLWLAIVFRSYWHIFLKSGFYPMAVKRKKWKAVIMVKHFFFFIKE